MTWSWMIWCHNTYTVFNMRGNEKCWDKFYQEHSWLCLRTYYGYILRLSLIIAKGTGSTSLRKDLRCVSYALYHSTRSTSLRKDLRCVSYAQRGVRSDGCHVSRLFIGIAS